VSDEGRVVFGAPSRVAFGGPKRGWLYVADASNNNVMAVNIPKISSGPILIPPPRVTTPPRKGGE
ncbi:MAG TPA: hypothetical protein VGJ29_02470, partial [Vicinamibacterales bacterium]|jgi:hypothetical protein